MLESFASSITELTKHKLLKNVVENISSYGKGTSWERV